MNTRLNAIAITVLSLGIFACEERDSLSPAADDELDAPVLAAGKLPALSAGKPPIGAQDTRNGCGSGAPSALAADLTRHDVALDGGQTIGPDDAPVTMVVFFDYSCPFCKRTGAALNRLNQEYGDDLRIVIKHAPLPMHESAPIAARAAMAAGQQDAFWPYHNALLEHKGIYDREIVLEIANELNLNMRRFESDLDDEASTSVLEDTNQQAIDLQVTGRPTSFINGVLVQGNHIDRYNQLIEAELAAAP